MWFCFSLEAEFVFSDCFLLFLYFLFQSIALFFATNAPDCVNSEEGSPVLLLYFLFLG